MSLYGTLCAMRRNPLFKLPTGFERQTNLTTGVSVAIPSFIFPTRFPSSRNDVIGFAGVLRNINQLAMAYSNSNIRSLLTNDYLKYNTYNDGYVALIRVASTIPTNQRTSAFVNTVEVWASTKRITDTDRFSVTTNGAVKILASQSILKQTVNGQLTEDDWTYIVVDSSMFTCFTIRVITQNVGDTFTSTVYIPYLELL
jgi:hypothetical protein